jgi:hypothetical protein
LLDVNCELHEQQKMKRNKGMHKLDEREWEQSEVFRTKPTMRMYESAESDQ